MCVVCRFIDLPFVVSCSSLDDALSRSSFLVVCCFCLLFVVRCLFSLCVLCWLLLVVRCWLLVVARYLLCVLFVDRCWLPVICYLLFVASGVLYHDCCLSFVACCSSLCVVCCVVFIACCVVFVLQGSCMRF